MFWGIYELVLLVRGLDEDGWLQLWAGVFGAVPAAVISAAVAAAVAVTVLNRSNEHQRLLSERASQAQHTQSERALEEQREQLEKQLSEQRRISEQQLSEQRAQAALAREKDAIAAVISATSRLIDASDVSRDAIDLAHSHLSDALVRWRLEIVPSDLDDELKQWDALLLAASVNRFVQKRMQGGRPRKSWEILNSLASRMSFTALRWQSAEQDSKARLLETLTKERERWVIDLDAMTGVAFPR